MANTERVSGVDTYVLYKEQTDYETAANPDTLFGGLIRNANFEVQRSLNERAGFRGAQATDGRITAQLLPGTRIVTGTIEFDAQRWDWLQYLLLGGRTGSGTTATPYIYSVGKDVKALTVSENIDNTTNSRRAYEGMVINSASISCSVGEPVNVSVNLLGGNDSKNTTLDTAQAQLEDEVYNFSGGSVDLGDGVIDNIIDSVNLDINNNFTVLYGFNETSKNARPGKLNISFRVTMKYLDDEAFDMLNTNDTADVVLKFEKGTNKYIEFTLKDTKLNTLNSRHELNEFVVEEIDVLPKNIEVKEVV